MKIICIHNNYPSSSGIKSVPEYPVYFLKPESALLINNYPFFIPDHSKRIIPKVNVASRFVVLARTFRKNLHIFIMMKLALALIWKLQIPLLNA